MIVCKATDKDGNTRGVMHWDVGVTNRATGRGNALCSPDVLHVYRTPEQAAFMISAHAEGYTRLWEVEVPKVVADDGTKCGVKKATVLREIPMPALTTEQRVEIAIRVSLLVYHEPGYIRWAEDWLSGNDRSARAEARAVAAAVAAAAAESAARAAWAVAAAESAGKPIDLISIIDAVMGKE